MDASHLTDVSACLTELCKINPTCRSDIQGLLSKQIWNPKDREDLLRSLTELYLNPECAEDITRSFSCIILDLLERNKQEIILKGIGGYDCIRHQKFCISLSKSLHISSEVARFCADYLKQFPPFFTKQVQPDEPVSKKAKKEKSIPPRKREIIHAVYRLTQHLAAELRHIWDWSDFMSFVEDKDPQTRWFALHSLALVTVMSPQQLQKMRVKYFTEAEANQFILKYNSLNDRGEEYAKQLAVPRQRDIPDEQTSLTHTMKGLVDTDLSKNVVSVSGVLLTKLTTSDRRGQHMSSSPNPDIADYDVLVPVTSTQANLRSLALAVANGSPVLLEGPVGSGKTALVEHLARVTGRDKTPLLMKIQLGDQTDSKALQGTYCCTDIPGEFVWQPGSLTKAVTEGHWILLEDLDYAPMDVISILAPLLESSTLSLPGHGDIIKASPNFRIFATQRLLTSSSGLYKQHSAGAEILEKLWTKIIVQPLSRTELKQVIVKKYPVLATVVDKLVDIYFLLAAGKHWTTNGLEESHSQTDDTSADVAKFLSHEGRLISTRDLMKWVSRIANDFDVSHSNTGNMVFQEALDCFCACLSKPDSRLPLAEAIAAKLNITKVKAEFYCSTYKPAIEITKDKFSIGRVNLERKCDIVSLQRIRSSFAFTRQSVGLLERVAVCTSKCEPVLLVGETGVGKTSSIQYLAEQVGKKLRVINMNQQSGSSDLLGGYKPVDLRLVVAPFREDFEILFCDTFSRKQNAKFLGHIQECFSKRRWSDLFKLMEHTQKAAKEKCELGSENHKKWISVGKRLKQLKSQVKKTESVLAFTFIEGTLVRALKKGDWVLLDEINLASAETLECLSGLLESKSGSVVLLERGDSSPIVRHPEFRLFACMNPATDVGKKDLPPGLRNRFTEFFVDELQDSQELKILVAEYLKGLSLSSDQIDGLVKFYQIIKIEAVKKLTDGTGRKPHFSLRTLCRSLRLASLNTYGNVLRSLYEAFCLSFLTQLDRSSHPIVEKLVRQHIVGKGNLKGLLKQEIPAPSESGHLKFEGYWLSKGAKEPEVPEGYVLTPSVRANLKDLARVVSAGRFPVLIQGETSVGKTSLVTWLAKSCGNVCMRINNHEHTDLQEYIGCYAADHTGKLVFQEGVLVEAMRKGHWIILDELNLAPTDVLEALNRLLDDNRELFIPETQETIKAHPKFMLFATQNPPGQYGGRKVLSRAFRNRFVELHFDEIPPGELETILHNRCALPLSYSKKLVAVLLDLQTRRRGSGVFAGKQGFITLRDLFRWAERYRLAAVETKSNFFDWDQLLADNGYMVLAGRVRKPEESIIIQEVLQKHLKRKVNPNNLFSFHENTTSTTIPILKTILQTSPKGFEHVVWTYSMRRMAVLVGQALKFGEPVLLVGETGCGKTTVCQLYAALKEQHLYSVNCHMHTEGSDFLGGLRPVRHRSENDSENQRLFEWCDGPLVCAMKEGNMFMVDEISLADDSVLERLNSVLEPERTLLLAEKGGSGDDLNQVEQVVANDQFRVVGTMNPGGDYGKKELSPALRNRFTEIWCPLGHEREDLIEIIEHNIKSGVLLSNQEDGSSGFGKAMMDFIQWFSNNDIGKRVVISIRDLLSWTHFINLTAITVQEENQMDTTSHHQLEPAVAYIHGACLVFLDALGSGVTGSLAVKETRELSLTYLINQMTSITGQKLTLNELGVVNLTGNSAGFEKDIVRWTKDEFGIGRFYIPVGPKLNKSIDRYTLQAPTTCLNAQRVLRALRLPRPMMLEGSPGVGKTSLVAAIAKASGNELIRINLSEQTDVSDLFGSDLPVEGGKGGQFAWRDGPLLQALKAGHWIVLDELNLASQSVLEGLNACLDHRAEVYVPELSMTFKVQHEKTRLFACQNPLNQGGGRKGLPKSFLNRFTQVYVEPLSTADLLFITKTMYPEIAEHTLLQMIEFNEKVHNEAMVKGSWGQKGSPWEFNLRDVFRWADLLLANQQRGMFNPAEYVGLIYTDRMRTNMDKRLMAETFTSVFGPESAAVLFRGEFNITNNIVQVGHSFLERNSCVCSDVTSGKMDRNLLVVHHLLPYMESVMKCIEMKWMTILVGASSCGKTSLVHLLSKLTGNVLDVLPVNSAMDTTELLGGFEQADLKRHLEDIEKRLKNILNAVVKTLIVLKLKHSLKIVSNILHHWYSIKNNDTKAEESTSKEEVLITKKRIDKLRDLISLLINSCNEASALELHQHTSELVFCQSQLDVLSSQLEIDQNTNQGGRFEWVNSIFVKALQEGHWLLVENVNFCSPSVLDRLNALLEPGGVLSINERGVIGDSIPVVKPHPNFRLFLTMDPKYGEISRAMRNRGVEIYILGEHEGVPYSDQDLKQMLHQSGLVGKVPCETLLTLHQNVNGCGLRTKFNLTDVLRVAQLTHQQLERGIDLKTGLCYSCSEVYMSGITDHRERQVLKDVINESLGTFDLAKWEEETGTSSVMDVAHWPDGLPTVNNWLTSVSLAKIQQKSAIINHLINLVSLKIQSRSKLALSYGELDKGTRPSGFNLDFTDIMRKLTSALKITLETSDSHTWQLLLQYLLGSIHKKIGKKLTLVFGEQQCDNDNKAFLRFARNLEGIVKSSMQGVYDHPLFEMLHDVTKKLFQNGIEKVSISPGEMGFDLRWCTELLKYVKGRSPECLMTEQWVQIFNVVNQLYLVVNLTQNQILHQDSLMEEFSMKKLKRKEFSPLQISFAFLSGMPINENQIGHESFIHLHTFVQLLDKTLLDVYKEYRALDDNKLEQVLESLLWYEKLVHICQLPLKSLCNDYSNLSPILCLHWNWVYNHVLEPLVKNYSIPQELITVVKKLHRLLGADHIASQLYETIWTSLGHPIPYQSEKDSKNVLDIFGKCQEFDILGPNAVRKVDYVNKVALWMEKGQDIKQVVFCAMKKYEGSGDNDAEEDNEETTQKSLTALDQLITEYNIQSNTTAKTSTAPRVRNEQPMAVDDSAADKKVSYTVDSTKLALWPFLEMEQILSGMSILDQTLNGSSARCNEERNRWIEFQKEQVFVPPNYLYSWMVLSESLEKESILKSSHTDLILSILQRLSSNTVLRNPDQWTTWKPDKNEDADFCQESKLSALENICGAILSNVAFIIFTGDDQSNSSSKGSNDDIWLPSNITLGQMNEKMEQLKFMTGNLCKHLGVVKSSQWSFRENFWKICISSLQQLLSSLVTVLPEAIQMDARRNIKQLSSSSKETVGDSLNELSVAFDIKALDTLLPEFKEIMLICLQDLKTCMCYNAKNSSDEELKAFAEMLSLGKLMARIGLLHTFLLVPQGPVDPAQKVAVILNYSNQELDSVKTELHVRNWNHQVQCGMDLDVNHPDVHPHVRYLVERTSVLQDRVKVYSEQVAFRPKPSQFDTLLQETKQYLGTNGAVDKIKMMITKLEALHECVTSGKHGNRQVLNEVQAWNNSVEELIRRLKHNFPLYRDLVIPFLAGVAQTQIGLQLSNCAVKMLSGRLALIVDGQKIVPSAPLPQKPWLERTLTYLCKFPFIGDDVPNSLVLARQRMSVECIDVVRHLIDGSAVSKESWEHEVDENLHGGHKENSTKCISRVLSSCLQLIKTYATLAGQLDTTTVYTLSEVFSVYVSSWQQQEADKKRKEIEEASLYKYKEQSHGDELKEEEKEERDRKRMFPTYDEDFDDITIGFALDGKPKKDSLDKKENIESDVEVEIGQLEMGEISNVHKTLFTNFTNTSWYSGRNRQGKKIYQMEYVQPVVSCYQVGATLGKMYAKNIVQDFDGDLFGAHLLASSVLQNSVEPVHDIFKKPECKPFDVYFDSNVPEAIRCRPLLEKLKTRVKELLLDWEDHPTLKELITVIGRVMTFPVTGPVMKFVTGIEVLVQKAQEWESNAARHVSLREHIDSFTQLIIQWRKLELQCWKTCLDGALYKVEQRAYRWWFYLYQMVGDFLQDKSNDHQNKESTNDENECNSPKDVLKALQTFFESSNLGEFKIRLELVHAFLLQIVHMETSETQRILITIFWNVHTHYKQFLVNVQQQITKLRSPIEKDLKNFVKIARWNDINFYAMKKAVEKTHKTLHKHVKEFQKVLYRPVQNVLTENSSDLTEHNQNQRGMKALGDSGELHSESIFVLKTDLPKEVAINLPVCEDSVLQKLPILCKKVLKHARSVMQQQKLGQLVQSVEEFTGELIETVHELQSLDVTSSADKDKQKSQAKHIHQRKRKALADLFKYLQSLGLSYRKGIVLLQDPSVHEKMLSPLDVSASLANTGNVPAVHQQQCDLLMSRCWEGCEKYQMRCISRNALFFTSLNSPSKELGPGNIERCKGFTTHLSHLVTEQWDSLASFWEEFLKIRENVLTLNMFAKSDQLFCQDSAKQQIDNVKSVCDQLMEFLEQIKIILLCFPKRSQDTYTINSPLPAHHFAKLLASCQEDETWQMTFAKVEAEIAKIVLVKENIDKISLRKVGWISDCDISIVESTLSALGETKTCILIDLKSILVKPHSGEENCLTESFCHIESQINKSVASFQKWKRSLTEESVDSMEDKDNIMNDASDSVNNLCSDLENVVTKVLLGIQNLVKLKDTGVIEVTTDDGEEHIDLQDGHITEHLLKRIKNYTEGLKLHEVATVSKALVTSLSKNPSLTANHHMVKEVVCQLLPITDQYMLLAQYFITQSTNCLRSSAKLLSVLLGIFSELVLKGFCLPAEYSDEVEGEGATEFKDIEGGGLGEGEGVKDVSDQIESEDQLDETQKNNEETKEEDNSKQPDVKPEDNAIEMSEDFDGNMQDMEAKEGNDSNSEDENEDDENELDKQMGDVDDMGESDKLDEQIWGSDDEQEESEQDKDKKEEFGPGAGQESQPELVAKDDNQDSQKPEKQDDKDDRDQQEQKDDEEVKQHDLDQQLDEREFDENEVDPYQNQDKKDEKENQELELPDNLDLDKDMKEEEESGNKDDEQVEENPHDIDKMIGEEDTQPDQEGEENDGEDEVGEPDDSKQEDVDGGEEDNKEHDDADNHEGEQKENNQEELMDIDEDKNHGDNPDNQQGFEPQDENEDQNEDKTEDSKPEADDVPQAAEQAGKTAHDTQDVQQVEGVKDAAGKSENDQEEKEGVGATESKQEEGHHGESQSSVTTGGNTEKQQRKKRKPGVSKEERSLGSAEENIKKRLKTVDSSEKESDKLDDNQQKADESDMYEHIKDSTSQHDAQTMDAATDEQQKQQPEATCNDEENDDDVVDDDEKVKPMDDKKTEQLEVEKMSSAKLKSSEKEKEGLKDEQMDGDSKMDEDEVKIDGDNVATYNVARGEDSIHTAMDYLDINIGELDIEKLRQELEEDLYSWNISKENSANDNGNTGNEAEVKATEVWQKYEAVTAGLSQELCEQLRLVLEPSQASKLKGDYRTGKRLNMRKVIPYIASQFRKDKIWLRRTKPSKRNYQVMLAVDDSSSMADNHSKQLAFESLATIANALTLLEVGQLSVCSFGETVQELHPFHEQFTHHSGARILQQFTFEQKKTKIAQLLQRITAMMVNARSQQVGQVTNIETSQLLLVVSDGRGLFLEGMEVVKSAVRQCREANVFVVFVVLDNPLNKDSILDIRVPVFKGQGQLPEIKSYMDHFPFPFYIILRDINSLPNTLSDALRQWFELVTAVDR